MVVRTEIIVFLFSATCAPVHGCTFGAIACFIFPVTGHFYSVCHRNTGSIVQKMKKKESIQTSSCSLKLIPSSRTQSFDVVDALKRKALVYFE